jgi:lipopolysaccharide transport system ATP-binding protein
MKPIIEVTHLGKKYTIRHQEGSYVTLRDTLSTVFRKSKNKKESFWALRDISFSVEKGEIIGIVGKNGAGKSTLLKILSQITPPTTGEIKLHGSVGSLLEVGTGFHPELTGRENIFLNGAILGMNKREIQAKFDQIVAFAGIEKFLDTPVKRYSSGMYVRLAFSVAAHMEPDILIIDEVLAVGDAEFQKKCLGKMEEVTQDAGRTILFVSHNLDAVRRICTKTIWINDGQIVQYGETPDVLAAYARFGNAGTAENCWTNTGTLQHDYFTPSLLEVSGTSDDMTVTIKGTLHKEADDITLGYALFDANEELLYWSYQTDAAPDLKPTLGENTFTSQLPTSFLNTGTYRVELIGGIHGTQWFFEPGRGNPSVMIDIERDFSKHPYWNQKRPGILAPTLPWNHL